MDRSITSHPLTGLTEVDARIILKSDGYNELPTQKKQNPLLILFRVVSEPMLLLLLGSGAIYFFMGEARDALMLLSFVFVVVGITFYQERKTEKTLEALRNLSSPRALVIRDGKQLRIPGREVVKGDLVIIHEGDRIPADSLVLSCENLTVDESLLTGESVPVRKTEWDGKSEHNKPGGDDLPFVYSGSLVVSGRGYIKAYRTGLETEIGKIGKSLDTIKDEETLLHKETEKIVRSVAVIGVLLCLVVILIYTFVRGNFIQGFLSGLTLSMAMLPEEFPVVLMIFLTLGAWRISKRKVLTRHASAIETLGAASVLCTDKTGTLTLNKLELANLYTNGSLYAVNSLSKADLPQSIYKLLELGILASQKDQFDPIEKELQKVGNLYLKDTPYLHDDWNLIKEYPLSKDLLALSQVWKSSTKNKYVIASKGAPEAILQLCHMSDHETKEILDQVSQMSEKGLRVLAGATAVSLQKKLPENQHYFDFKFLGLFGFVDPARPSAAAAVKEAYDAGIRVILITGDYPGTAQFIAKEVGIKDPDLFITGDQLEKMSLEELRASIKTINIFARVVPEQKLEIVNALKMNGEVVAMTGDGVNDAPALKAAHIGIAMGERGTDVAREASSLVLLNDDFSSIVAAVRLGRRIYSNLKRAMGYILSVHVPIAGMSLLPLAFNLPAVLFPAHIAFLELIIDPACSTVFESEKEDEDIMKKPPRRLDQPIFDLKVISINLLQGFAILVATFALYVYIFKSTGSEIEARSFAFTALVLSNLLLIVVNLSWSKNICQVLQSPNKALLILLVSAFICLMCVLYIPFVSTLFHLAPLHPTDFFLIGIVVFLSLAWFEIFKHSGIPTKFQS